MSSQFLPEPVRPGVIRSVERRKAELVARQAEFDLFKDAVDTEVRVGKTRNAIDADAELTQTCIDEEYRLVDFSRNRAGTDPEKLLLGMRKVQGYADRNDVRLYRRF